MAVEIEIRASLPTIYRLNLKLEDEETEKVYELPLGTVRFTMQPETADSVDFTFKTGDITTVYGTMKDGAPYTETDLNPAGTCVPQPSVYKIFFPVTEEDLYIQIISWR